MDAGPESPQSPSTQTRSKGWKGFKGKLFAKDDKDAKSGHPGHDRGPSPQQNYEVEDFLRPSTNAAAAKSLAAPKLDISAAKQTSRLSGSDSSAVSYLSLGQKSVVPSIGNEVQSPETYAPDEKWKPSKPTRRPGLEVGFTKSQPELIGEGGDEAEAPPAEISGRHAESRARSKSTSNVPLGTRTTMPIRKPVPSPPAPASRFRPSEYDIQPNPFNDTTSSVGDSNMRPLTRAPTGFAVGTQQQDADDYTSSDEEDDTQHERHNDLRPAGAGRFPNLRSSPQPPSHNTQQKSQRNIPSEALDQRAMRREPNLPDIALHASDRLVPQRGSTPSPENVASTASRHPASRPTHRGQPPEALPIRDAVPRGTQGMLSSSVEATNLENLYPTVSRSSVEFSQSVSDLSQPALSPPITANSRRSVSPVAPAQSRSRDSSYDHLSPPQSSHGHAQKLYQESNRYLGSQDSLMPPEYVDLDPDKVNVPGPRNESPARRPVPTKQYSSNTSDTARVSSSDNELRSFAAGVAPLNNILKMSAEAGSRPNLNDWLRAAIWWFVRGRVGLEEIVQGRLAEKSQSEQSARGFLLQQHVHLAKALWIITEIEPALTTQHVSHLTASNSIDRNLLDSFKALMEAMKRVCVSMAKRSLLPNLDLPLRTGIDTTIWIELPQIDQDSAWVLGGGSFSLPDDKSRLTQPMSAIPLGDTEKSFCYGRAFAHAGLAHGDDEVEQQAFPCIVSLVRNRGIAGIGAVVSSQSSLMRVEVLTSSKYGISWDHVRWESASSMIRIKLPHKLRLHVRCARKDFDSLFAIFEADQKVLHSTQLASEETPMQTLLLRSFQYNDTADTRSFPQDPMGRCQAMIVEQTKQAEGRAMRKTHAGCRLVVTTSLHEKHVSCLKLELETKAPLDYEYGPEDPNWPPAMRFRITEASRRRTINISFDNAGQRDLFRDMITGTILTQEEETALKLSLDHLTVCPAQDAASSTSITLPWHSLQVIDRKMADALKSPALAGQSLRIIALNKSGSIIDRLPVVPGELKLRLEPIDPACFKILRQPRKDISIASGPSHSNPDAIQALSRIHQLTHTAPTIISYHFRNLPDLHTFQEVITGFRVTFDSPLLNWGISRRRKGVPIYRSWDASSARIQIITQQGETQLLAFFTDYILADCLNFQLKETDVFEKTESKAGLPCVKLVDAKFILPGTGKHGERDQFEELKEGEVRRREVGLRFVSLDDLEFAAEHEDITLTFRGEAEREAFIKALPAPIAEHRRFGLNALKRG
ncbi:MAG: hypothetical protein M1828_003710 [Chrysothrix sp. TS-e1954]|nr:MAG: hypothetical protein M1828_003710 [Chrysothrix sp. TS-e1954]